MRTIVLAGLLLLSPVPAIAATWNHVPAIDQDCEPRSSRNPDAHSIATLLGCSGSTYGILADGELLQLDRVGNYLVRSALGSTTHKSLVLVDVKGERSGNVIHVQSLSLAR
ncbi:MAG TPA: hypothetical protein VFM53_03915 [Anaeromyxobacteraceae bacterium]|nr:hypothetical protein [Anaeromyxobacteraceae bacterium]